MPIVRRQIIPAAIGVAAVVFGSSANACTITATGIAFGAYDPRSVSVRDGTGSLQVDCATNVTGPVVSLGAGLSGSFSPRQMDNGGTRLNYNAYTDATRTTIWGNGSSGTATVTLSGGTLVGGMLRFTRTVYGRIPALQNVRAGTYGDTVIVTVTF